jgi:hypothetical protein
MKKLLAVLAAIAMVGVFAAVSVAADWSFYGSSRVQTARYDKSKEVAGINFDDQDTTWQAQANTRLGAKVKTSDTVGGRFEFQTGQDVGLRLMYGTWNFGAGTLLVGQDYTPGDTIISSSWAQLPYKISGTDPVVADEGDSLAIGSMYTSRLSQIKLTFGDFQVAFIQPKTTGAQGVYTDIDTTFPKVELNYKFKTDMFSVTPYAGYQTVDFTDPSNDRSVSIDSYIYGLTFSVNFGPAYVRGNVFGARNAQNYGRVAIPVANHAVITGVDDVNDSDTYGGIILVGYKINDMFAAQAGYAQEKSKIDALGVTSENKPSHWYVQATITLAPGVYIIPEVGMFDYGDMELSGATTSSTPLGDCTYYGAKWMINF